MDLVVLHPPYHDVITYSHSIESDLSGIRHLESFLAALGRVAEESNRVAAQEGHVALLMGDYRRRGVYVPLAFEALRIFLDTGLRLRESIVKAQWNCHSTGKWLSRPRSFHLIAHEHLFVFRKVSSIHAQD